MKNLIINVGVSGSGKTTWTTKFIKENPNYLRVNRDDIRKTLVGDLDGYYQRKDLWRIEEEAVNNIESSMILELLHSGFNVIVDNTNLKPTYIEKFRHIVSAYNKDLVQNVDQEVQIRYNLFKENNVALLKKRVDVREAPIDPHYLDYIDKQASQLKGIIHYIEDNYKYYILNHGDKDDKVGESSDN